MFTLELRERSLARFPPALAERGLQLDQALTRDPNFPPARWQSGFVRWEGEWLTPDQVAKVRRRRSAIGRLSQTARRDDRSGRRSSVRPAGVTRTSSLTPRRVHWAKVLEFDASDAEALKGLGLRLFAGRLMTRQQIAEAKEKVETRSRRRKAGVPNSSNGAPPSSAAMRSSARRLSSPLPRLTILRPSRRWKRCLPPRANRNQASSRTGC